MKFKSLILFLVIGCSFLFFPLFTNAVETSYLQINGIAPWGNWCDSSRDDNAIRFAPNNDVDLTSLYLKLKRNGTPGDLTIDLYHDTDSTPEGGDLMTSVTVPESGIGPSFAWVEFSFDESLTEGEVYWFVMRKPASGWSCAGSNYDFYYDNNVESEVQWWQDHVPGGWSVASSNDMAMIINHNIGMSATSDQTWYEEGDTVTYYGTCPTNAPDQIAINALYWQTLNFDYNIDCVSNQWTYDWTATNSGQVTWFFVDKGWPDEPAGTDPYFGSDYITYHTINVSEANYTWGIDVIYPENDGSKSFTLYPDTDFPFRFSYVFPPELDTDQVTIVLSSCTDSTCETADTTYVNNTISIIDSYNAGYFDTDLPVTDSQTDYYRVQMIQTDLSTVEYIYYFNVTGDTASEILPVEPGEDDLGFWGNLVRRLFVPHANFMRSKLQFLSDQAATRAPISYFYQMKTYFDDVNISSENINLTAQIPVANTNVNMTILDTSDSDVSDAIGTFRPWFGYTIWFMFVIYLIFRAKDLFTELG